MESWVGPVYLVIFFLLGGTSSILRTFWGRTSQMKHPVCRQSIDFPQLLLILCLWSIFVGWSLFTDLCWLIFVYCSLLVDLPLRKIHFPPNALFPLSPQCPDQVFWASNTFISSLHYQLLLHRTNILISSYPHIPISSYLRISYVLMGGGTEWLTKCSRPHCQLPFPWTPGLCRCVFTHFHSKPR